MTLVPMYPFFDGARLLVDSSLKDYSEGRASGRALVLRRFFEMFQSGVHDLLDSKEFGSEQVS
jgi:hypothetical protein